MVVDKVINASFTFNEMKVRVFPMFSVLSALSMVYIYFELMDLSHDREKMTDNGGDINEGEFLRMTYMKYRNLLIHLTNLVLVLQSVLAAKKYETYMDMRSKYED